MSTGGLRVLAVPIAVNEAGKIERVLDRMADCTTVEWAVMDDGSTDATPDIVRARNVALIRNERCQGVGAAIRTALRHARAHGFGIAVIMAGNDKDRPAEIPRLLQPIVEDGFDFVQGSRYLPGGEYGQMPFYRYLATRYVHPLLFSLVARRRVTDSTNGFRAIRLALLDDARIDLDQPWLDQYELEPYLMNRAIRLGYKFKEVPVTKIYPPKALGYTKMKPIVGWWSILKPLVLLALKVKR
jgi:dolichol-phosphate mannosyltransferase